MMYTYSSMEGNWINRHENKIEIKNFNFKFWI